MSRNLKYRGFFVTVAARCGVPDPIAEQILAELTKRCDEVEYVPEQHESGKIHVHFMLLCRLATKRENFKQTVQRIVEKHIAAPDVRKGIDVRVIKDVAAVREYMSKSADMVCAFPKLIEYVTENFETADEIIKANAFYRDNQIKYAYDNWETWKTELDWTAPVQEIWMRYRELMALHDGKSPATRWKLEYVFECMGVKAGLFDNGYLLRDTPQRFMRGLEQ